jgi:hypothetical protein
VFSKHRIEPPLFRVNRTELPNNIALKPSSAKLVHEIILQSSLAAQSEDMREGQQRKRMDAPESVRVVKRIL